MKLETIQAAEKKLLLNTYERNPLLFVGGQGVYLRDEDGNEYLDLLSGIGVSALGYGHPVIEDAIAAQSKRLLHTSNLFFHEHTAELALRLTEMSGLDRVFLCNSGTEAWEAALKLARAHSVGVGLGKKFLALEHSFHGRTMGSVATTQKLAYRAPFAPVMPDVEFIQFNDVADLRAHFSAEVCAILIEPIQGEGGIHPVSQEFFQAARELCSSTGALLVADEIQCGFGRTGEWFGFQHFRILPDVVTLAKPLAGGLPIGAMLCTERAGAAITPGMHGTTFGGGAAGVCHGDCGHRRDEADGAAGARSRYGRVLSCATTRAGGEASLHYGGARGGVDAGVGAGLRRAGEGGGRGDAGAAHHHQPDERYRAALSAAVPS